MSTHSIAQRGFRYSPRVNGHGKMDKEPRRLEGWQRILWIVVWTLFFLLLLIVL